ncbi:MAG: hypothetical protein L6V88_04690 [Anaerotruncus sp.]|nr:MAG: hypothetical protein L6V88_04690 [Anaerotruncus sp.]
MLKNYCTAISAVWGLVPVEVMKNIAQTFGGVEHRIEFVREFKGVKYYNDSIATSPSRVISGLKAFNQKIIMICGGSDKGNDMSQMVPLILEKVKLLVLNGATADKIYEAVTSNEKLCRKRIEKLKKPILCRMRLKLQKTVPNPAISFHFARHAPRSISLKPLNTEAALLNSL